MSEKVLYIIAFFFAFGVIKAQEIQSLYVTKKIITNKDSIYLDSTSLNSNFFKLKNKLNKPVDSTSYTVNFSKALLVLHPGSFNKNDTLEVDFLKYPSFLTKEYSLYDRKKVVGNEASNFELYQIKTSPFKKNIPFDGLNTTGSISRGVTIGNNQNAVVNAALDLQISGKLSNKVTLRASIQDSNVPLQEGGYSQRLDQFDQIFIELFSNKWSVRAGDLFLENRTSKFLNFNKKVQGLSTFFELGNSEVKTTIFNSAALVRGQYAKSVFVGQEGNQGPYKLKGTNGELYVLVISGSERVFVNGILLKRGENADYMIDYNAGEIRFTSLFPITSEMRISIEYQYSDRNYNRILTYNGAKHEAKTWSLSGNLYTENDVKNQPLQQSLSPEQAIILANAGDNVDLMSAPSAYLDSYSDNKILYEKLIQNGTEVFVYSNNQAAVLYNVKFTFIGDKKGNYVLRTANAVGKIFDYSPPINGILQGSYEPSLVLVPPTKLQIANVTGRFNPSEKTNLDFELGLSNNDKNLFSTLDDNDNQGFAFKMNAKQRLLSKKWLVDAFSNFQLVQKQFKTIERLNNIEFSRDWNLPNVIANQSLLISGLNVTLPNRVNFNYQFEKLDLKEQFSGNRQVIKGNISLNRWIFQNNSSFLNTDSDYSKSNFIRTQNQIKYHFKNNWIGGSYRMENNSEKLKPLNNLSNLSQKFSELGAFMGKGDSTKVFVNIGFLQRVNDSLQNGFLNKVNTSKSYFIKSKLIQNDKTDLSLFVNYRNLNFEDTTKKDQSSLNSRILYNDQLFNQFLQLTTSYETVSGTIAQQEFTYVEVKEGQGVYIWIDYNLNNIQELEEFEVAKFIDQAKYIRVFLPNQTYRKTHQNKFSQSVVFNPTYWQNDSGFKRFLSFFYNQMSFIAERKIERVGNNFDLNPFSSANANLLGINTSFRNSLYFNRGKQYHSVTYNYFNSHAKNLLSVGSQESFSNSHQLQYTHLYLKTWLFNATGKTIYSKVLSENYNSKNYTIVGFQINPKISYLFSKNTSWDLFYEFQNKKNDIGNFETLLQHQFGTSFGYSNLKQFTVNGALSIYNNHFTGDQLSAVSYQMLEGLQAGKNVTWRLLIQKNITQYLDINFNYQGRKSETSQAIHTGNIQLRAYF